MDVHSQNMLEKISAVREDHSGRIPASTRALAQALAQRPPNINRASLVSRAVEGRGGAGNQSGRGEEIGPPSPRNHPPPLKYWARIHFSPAMAPLPPPPLQNPSLSFAISSPLLRRCLTARLCSWRAQSRSHWKVTKPASVASFH